MYGFRAVPVISAPFDSKCAFLAGGLSEPGIGLDISGTVTSLAVFQTDEIEDVQKRIYSIPHNRGWLVRGSTACAGSALEWARCNLLKTDFVTWTKHAAMIEPGANGVIFLPYLAGERTPLWNPSARAGLLGLTLDTNDGMIGRAVFESLAFTMRNVIDVMRECGAVVKNIKLSGGLSQNDLLSQIKADVTGLPLDRLQDFELTSLGLVAIANVALGSVTDLEAVCTRLTVVERRFKPCPEMYQVYQAHYARYRNYMQALLPTFAS
jgi:xylulokinase